MNNRRGNTLTTVMVMLATLSVVGGTAYAVLLGCGSSTPAAKTKPKPKPVIWQMIPSGVVETAGVTITAQDASFRLEGPSGGAPAPLFRTPFMVDCHRLGRLSPAKWKTAGTYGARAVEIIVPGRQRPIYGVLALCKAHPKDGSAAARSYRIVVPKSRVDQTSGGRVSYVYELGSNVTRGGWRGSWATWVLWLSESPLPVYGGGGVGGGVGK